MAQTRDLPKDLDSLTKLVIEQQVTLKGKDFEIEHLRLQVARMRNLKFGQSSERFEGTVDQLHLGIDQSEVKVPPPPDPNLASDTAERIPKRKKPIRDALPEYLPREPKVHPPLFSCPDCGGGLRKIRAVTTESLLVPSWSLTSIAIIRPTIASAKCARGRVPPAPPLSLPTR